MTAMTRPVPSHMTCDEFVGWDAPTPFRWQLIDGKPTEMPPADELHGAIQCELARLIANHLVERNSPCRGLIAPGIVPPVRADMNYRIPDFGVTCAPLGGAVMMPEPLLLAEILSPSNEPETRANVWAYATISSVQEILLLRGSRIEAELLRRDAAGNWPAKPVILGPDASLVLDRIGYIGPLAAIYRTTGLAA